MSSNSRDTQFSEFAKLLYDELKSAGYTAENHDPDQSIYREYAIELIARRAYDLATHVLIEVNSADLASSTYDETHFLVDTIPDLIEWPSNP